MYKQICYELITKGSFTVPKYIEKPDLSIINSTFRSLNCIAKYWYDNSVIILIDNNEQSIAKTEIARKDAAFFIKIINNDIMYNYERKDLLYNNGWIDFDNVQIVLSKKFILQHKNFILANSDQWFDCSICKILVYQKNIHTYCQTEKTKRLKEYNSQTDTEQNI
ncbi:hypothetical protein COBT_000208 [Conglomerata obtusa]